MSANFFFFMKICFSSSRRFLFPIFDKEKSHRAEKISKQVDSAHLGQVGPITIRLTRGDSGQIFFTTLHFFFSFFFRRFLFFFSPHRKNCRKIIKIYLEAEEVKKKIADSSPYLAQIFFCYLAKSDVPNFPFYDFVLRFEGQILFILLRNFSTKCFKFV